MKLLILTQAVDENNPVLGFFLDWIKEFSKHCENVTVICLFKGVYDLPANVKVLSLGKENNRYASRAMRYAYQTQYLIRFYKYIWQERKNYDAVFVHMNREYVVLGGLFWLLLGKKIFLWYNHQSGNIFSIFAGWMAQNIFFTSPYSFFAQSVKARQMPAGINLEIFKNHHLEKKKNSILFLSRISPVKNLETLIEAVKILDKASNDYILDIYGDAPERDRDYLRNIKSGAETLMAKGKINFKGSVINQDSPSIYNSHDIFVNLTNSGSLDKTTLEAMACETLVLVSNSYYQDFFPHDFRPLLMFKERDAVDLAEHIIALFNLADIERRRIGQGLSKLVANEHDYKLTVNNVFNAILKKL